MPSWSFKWLYAIPGLALYILSEFLMRLATPEGYGSTHSLAYHWLDETLFLLCVIAVLMRGRRIFLVLLWLPVASIIFKISSVGLTAFIGGLKHPSALALVTLALGAAGGIVFSYGVLVGIRRSISR